MAIDPGSPLNSYKAIQNASDAELTKFLTDMSQGLSSNASMNAMLGTLGNAGKDPLRLAQIQIRKDILAQAMAQMSAGVEAHIGKWQTAAGMAGYQSVAAYEAEILKRYKLNPADKALLQTYLDNEIAGATTNIAASWERFSGQSAKKLSDRVWGSSKIIAANLERAINTGLATGLSAKELGKTVEKFISPKYPGGASYAAFRLARTEINNAFHSMEKRRAEDSPFVDAVQWNISSSHPEKDLCDDYGAHMIDEPVPTEHDPNIEDIAQQQIDKRKAEQEKFFAEDEKTKAAQAKAAKAKAKSGKAKTAKENVAASAPTDATAQAQQEFDAAKDKHTVALAAKNAGPDKSEINKVAKQLKVDMADSGLSTAESKMLAESKLQDQLENAEWKAKKAMDAAQKKLDDLMAGAVKSSAPMAPTTAAEAKAWMKTLPSEEQFDLMHTIDMFQNTMSYDQAVVMAAKGQFNVMYPGATAKASPAAKVFDTFSEASTYAKGLTKTQQADYWEMVDDMLASGTPYTKAQIQAANTMKASLASGAKTSAKAAATSAKHAQKVNASKVKYAASGKATPSKIESLIASTDARLKGYNRLQPDDAPLSRSIAEAWGGATGRNVTGAVQSYSGSAYSSINGYLRGDPSLAGNSGAKRAVAALDKLFEKGITTKDGMATRGMNHHQMAKELKVPVKQSVLDKFGVTRDQWDTGRGSIDDYDWSQMIGQTWKADNYWSVSYDGHGRKTQFERLPLQLEIFMPKGTRAVNITDTSVFGTAEREVLLDRDSHFTILGVEKRGQQVFLQLLLTKQGK